MSGREDSVRLVGDKLRSRLSTPNSRRIVGVVTAVPAGSSSSISTKDASNKRGADAVGERDGASGGGTGGAFAAATPLKADREAGVYTIGCIGVVSKLTHVRAAEGERYTLLVEGVARMEIRSFVQRSPYIVARVDILADIPRGRAVERGADAMTTRTKALVLNLQNAGKQLINAAKKASGAPQSIEAPTGELVQTLGDTFPSRLAFLLTAVCGVDVSDKQRVLEASTLDDRLEAALFVVNAQMELLKVTATIHNKVETQMKDGQRKFILRQQMEAIRKELGEGADGEEGQDDAVAEVEARLAGMDLPSTVRKVCDKELKRARRMNPMLPELSVLVTYLEWIADLPWDKSSEDSTSISVARNQLDADHFGLEKVKKRVLEFLSVRQLNPAAAGPILCLVGPPGVGKTSLGRSIAAALGRKFCRLSLGGVHDEAEIRGHRRTYIGAMPGKIVQTLKRVGTNNPVILLDEVDKLGNDFRGDPAAALLEVLDPEQNNSFTDHYLGVPFDLSKVMFIATANQVEPIAPALLDRLELINLAGYTHAEKRHIAMQYLVPKQVRDHSLTSRHIAIPEETVSSIVNSYTSEAGVRSLEKQLAGVCRHVAVKLASWRTPPPFIAASTFEGRKPRYTYREGPEGVGYYVDKAFVTRHGNAKRDADAAIADGGGDNEPSEDGADHDDRDGMYDADAADAPLAHSAADNASDSPDGEDAKEDPRDAEFERVTVTPSMLSDILGVPQYDHETCDRGVDGPGIATGLAWTAAGGELLFVEAMQMVGTGKLTLTGQLGDVMKESARTALSWIRSHAGMLGLSTSPLDSIDIHVHFPAGAIPKDGPSAGVAVTMALVSMLTGRTLRSDTAMTGEVTLRGAVMPVGGIKEKVMGAHRGGVRRVVLPAKNARNVADIPKEVRDEMEVCLVSTIDDALALVFTDSDADGKDKLASGVISGDVASAGAGSDGVELPSSTPGGQSPVSGLPADTAEPLLVSRL